MRSSSHGILIVSLALLVAAGCGNGLKMHTSTNGEIETGVLSLDSLPQGMGEDEYRISYGDVLSIQVLYHSEYTTQGLRVLPDGKISYPHIGTVRVAGLTVLELKSMLIDRFAEIIKDPEITVILTEHQPQRIYVIGEVKVPGGYPIEREMTLLKAIARGHGVTPDGKKNGVVIIRRVSPIKVVGIHVDLKQLLDEHRFELDIPLKQYDIVYVPKTRIARARDFVSSFYEIFDKPMALYLKGWQAWNVKTTYEFYRAQAQGF